MSLIGLTPYLFFGGRCEEAINYYSQHLGAKLEMLMRFCDSPDPPPPGMLQAGFEQKVMHASLSIGSFRLMLSDGCDDRSNFDGFRLALNYQTEEETQRVFSALAEGGTVEMPLTKTFWSPCYGMLTDRFKVQWMVMVYTQ